MRITSLLLGATALVGIAFPVLPVQAGTIVPIVWDFKNPTGTLGTTQVYNYTPTVSGVAAQPITASGFHCAVTACNTTTTPVTLFGKAGGTAENGLGLTNDPTGQDEITPGNFIQLDLNKLSSSTLVQSSLSFEANSVQSPDAWEVLGTNTAGTLAGATVLDSGTDANLVAQLPNFTIGQYKYLDVIETAAGGNILLSELDNEVMMGGSSVPEPATLALLGSALFGFGWARRRRGTTATA